MTENTELRDRIRFRVFSWPSLLVGVFLVKAILPLTFKHSEVISIFGGLLYFLLLLLAGALSARNAAEKDQDGRPFWTFIAVGFALWALDQWFYVYYGILLRSNLPDDSLADLALFLHLVPWMAAIAIRPDLRRYDSRVPRDVLAFLILLFFWAFIYSYLLIPYQYLFPNSTAYDLRFDVAYGIENIVVVSALGIAARRASQPWSAVYIRLFGAAALYAVSSTLANIAIDTGRAYNGTLYSLAQTASICWFVWIPLYARRHLKTQTTTPAVENRPSLRVGLIAVGVVAASLLCVWELFWKHEAPGLRSFRLAVLLGAFLLFSAAALVKEYLENRDLAADLSLANERLHLAMESGQSVGWERDLTSGRDHWFGDLRSMFGIPSETFVGSIQDFYRYVHPEDRQRVSNAVAHARTSRELYSAEFRVLWPNGTIRWVSARGTFHYGGNGEPKRMLGMAIDITDRKKTESALRKSEEKFSKAFRESPLALTITSVIDQRYLEVNQTFEQITGWTNQEVIGRTPFDIGLWIDPSKRQKMVKQILAGQPVRNLEVHFRKKGGEIGIGLASAELIEIAGEPCLLSVISDITDRKLAEEKRLHSENRFRRFFATIPEYCSIISPTGDIQDVNPAACNILGYTRDELVGKPLSTLYAPECLPRMNELFGKWKTEGEIRDQEMVILTKSGERRTVLLNAASVKDSGGNVLHSTLVQVDITERQLAEEKLHESQKQLAALVASAMDAIVALDEAQNIVVFNAAAEKMFVCSAQDAMGKPIMTLIPERFRADYGLRIRRFGQTETTAGSMGVLGALWARRANGEEFPIEASISHLQTDGKRLFTVIIRDVTERRRAEEALQESEQRFRLVANTAPVMIWMSGPDKLCNYFNRPWLEFTGRPLASELGNGWADAVHPDDLAACMDTYTRMFDQRLPFGMQYRLRRHDGEYRWVFDRGVPRFHADGSFAGFIGSCSDVTDHKLAEEALSSISQRLLEAAEEERTRIARELHDDINQRIALLAIELDLARQSLSASEVDAFRRLRRSCKNLSEIGKDIQAISHRLHSSKLEYLGITAAARSFCRELSEQQKVTIDFNSTDVPHDIPNDVSLCLFRVMQEALYNAVKHSGVRHFIVDLRRSGDELELLVGDTGSGFDADAAISGHGLGLISMQERLRLVKGSFSIDSAYQRGTTVHARVPLAPRSQAISPPIPRVG